MRVSRDFLVDGERAREAIPEQEICFVWAWRASLGGTPWSSSLSTEECDAEERLGKGSGGEETNAISLPLTHQFLLLGLLLLLLLFGL